MNSFKMLPDYKLMSRLPVNVIWQGLSFVRRQAAMQVAVALTQDCFGCALCCGAIFAAAACADVGVSMRLSVAPLTESVAAAMARDEEFPAWLAGLPHERLAMREKMRKVCSSLGLGII